MQPVKPITKSWFIDVWISLAMAGVAGLLGYGMVTLTWWVFGKSIFVGVCLAVTVACPFVLVAIFAASAIEYACLRIAGQLRREEPPAC